jgi:hypothetical protein
VGPLEQEVRQRIESALLGSPEILDAQLEGREDLDAEQALRFLREWITELSKCLVRVAEEVDRQRAP